MNTKYALSSNAFEGNVEFTYNADGLLVAYLLGAELTEHQLVYLLNKMPREEDQIKALHNGVSLTVTKLASDLSFDRFWEIQAPGKKINKIRCIPLWKKMKDAKKALALERYHPYTVYCNKNNRPIVDPENYLKKEYFETDFKKLLK